MIPEHVDAVGTKFQFSGIMPVDFFVQFV